MNYNNLNLVVGAGFSGAVIANLIANKLNEQVLIIDKKSHIAGNCYDFKDEKGITIHQYGSHIFHTNSEKVWEYLNRFTDFNTYMHKVIGIIDGIETHIPFNFNTLYDVFPKDFARKLEKKLLSVFELNSKVSILEFQKQDDADLKFLADYIYEKVFFHYTIKQWGISPNDIDKSITSRVPIYLSNDNRYFQDKYQGIPLEGYTKTVEKMLNHKNIHIELNKDFNTLKNIKFKRIFFTGSIDDFFNYQFGELSYRSVHFKFETHKKEFYQSSGCVNYPSNYDFTRIHEFKHFLGEKTDITVIAKEYSQDFILGENDRYYPIINEENTKLYEKYLNEANRLEDVYFLGRLGDYKYYNMDSAILRAIELFEELFNIKI